jgi:hypothetical protein
VSGPSRCTSCRNCAQAHKFRGWYGDQPEQTYKHNQISILESTITRWIVRVSTTTASSTGRMKWSAVDLICEYLFYVGLRENPAERSGKTSLLGVGRYHEK